MECDTGVWLVALRDGRLFCSDQSGAMLLRHGVAGPDRQVQQGLHTPAAGAKRLRIGNLRQYFIVLVGHYSSPRLPRLVRRQGHHTVVPWEIEVKKLLIDRTLANTGVYLGSTLATAFLAASPIVG